MTNILLKRNHKLLETLLKLYTAAVDPNIRELAT
jgi:hypothetical protein